MPVKLDGTNNQIILRAGTSNETALAGAAASNGWTMTLPVNPGVVGQVLVTDGSGNLSWGGSAGGALITFDDTTTDATFYPVTTDAAVGNMSVAYVSSTKYTYNPASGQLTAPHMASSAGIHLNANLITANYTLPTDYNGLSAGPITLDPGVSVTVPPGQAWVIV